MRRKPRKVTVKEIAEIHLNNIQVRGVRCGYFGTFYNDKNLTERCLLDEIRCRNGNGRRFFRPWRIKKDKICRHYDKKLKTKCNYIGNEPSYGEVAYRRLLEERKHIRDEALSWKDKAENAERRIAELTEKCQIQTTK